MNNLAFLLVALGVSGLGSVVLWLRSRKPVTLESSIDSFAREMRALSPNAPGEIEPAPGVRKLGGPDASGAAGADDGER